MAEPSQYKSDIVDLRSDTVTVPSEGMRRAIAEARVGDDVFGDDPTVIELQQMVADILGKEDALYCSSGTQTNQIALHIQTSPGEEVIVEESAHISINEVGAPGLLSGVILRPVRGSAGVMPLEEVQALYCKGHLHRRRTALICMENTHNMAGGRLYPLDEMEKLSTFAKENGARVHLDGARLFNASAVTGVPVSRYASLADTVSVCLSKGLGAPIGSCLAGSREDMDRARLMRKTLGGGMRQVGIIAAAGIYALRNNVERLRDDHENARLLADGLKAAGKFDVTPADVETNIVIFGVSGLGVGPEVFTEELGKRGVLMLPIGRSSVRAVTNLNVTGSDIVRALSEIRNTIEEKFGGKLS